MTLVAFAFPAMMFAVLIAGAWMNSRPSRDRNGTEPPWQIPPREGVD